jgi:hypothetical protein
MIIPMYKINKIYLHKYQEQVLKKGGKFVRTNHPC